MTESVEALFARFLAAGDEDALDQLFRRCSPPLRQLARRLGHGDADAEDLCQETMVVAIAAADRFDATRPLLPWLKGILARKAAQLAREDLRRRRLQAEVAARAAAAPPAPPPLDQELHAALHRALAQLPEKYRTPLSLHLLDGHSPQEVAAATGRSRPTVRVQLHRGMRLLRQKLPPGSASALLLLLDAGAAHGTGPGIGATLRAAARRVRAPHALLAGAAALALTVTAWRLGTSATPRPGIGAADINPKASAAPPVDPGPGTAAATRLAVPDRAPAPLRLQVLVVDAQGRGLPAVGVRVEPAAGLDPVAHGRWQVTAADGRVTVTLPAGDVAWQVRTDRGPGARITTAAPPAPLVLRVTGGTRAAGVVRDPAGRPVPDAEVWLSDGSDGPWTGTVVTHSDAAGGFGLEHVPAGHFLAARHARLGRSAVALVADAAPVVLTLPGTAGRVRATVRDHRQQPLADALVLVGEAMAAAPLGLAQGAAAWRPPPFELRTDAQGVAQAAGLEPGVHPVFVRAPGFAPWASHVTVRAQADTELTLDLTAGAQLRARVLGPDRAPVPGAWLVFRGRDRHCDIDTRTDAEGRVHLDCVPAGEGRVAARAPGLRPRATTLPLDAGQEHTLELALDARRAVTCTVVDAAGAALAGATLRVRSEASSTLDDGRQLATLDAQGRTTLFVDTGARLELELREAGAPLWRPVRAFLSWQPDGAWVRLPAGFAARSWLAGTLTGADGQPIADARLHLLLHPADATGAEAAPRQYEVGHSDATGAFRVGPLPAGEYELFVESTTDHSPSLTAGTYALAAGETRTVACQARDTGTVEFALQRADGGDAGDVVVTVVGGNPRRRFAVFMTATGTRPLPAGDYTLHAMGSRFRWIDGLPFSVRAGACTRLCPKLEPAVLRTLWLDGLPAGGAIPASARVVRLPDDEELGRWPVALDAPGPLAAALPVGSYRLELTLPSGEALSGRFQVPDLTPSFRALVVPLGAR